MAKGFKARGGGSNPLNFRVLGGTTAPANPKENDIWVNTDKEITGYYFSNKGVWNMVQGDVWIVTGENSNVPFDALKKNGIRINPLTAKQYISGAWVDVEAKSYQDGAWVDWWDGKTLYESGNEHTSATGGWEAKGWASSSAASNAVAPTLTKDAESMTLTNQGAGKSGVVHPQKDIDLTKITTITIEYTAKATYAYLVVVARDAVYWYTNCIAKVQLKTATTKSTLTLDVSGISGFYDIVVGVLENDTVTVYKIVME